MFHWPSGSDWATAVVVVVAGSFRTASVVVVEARNRIVVVVDLGALLDARTVAECSSVSRRCVAWIS